MTHNEKVGMALEIAADTYAKKKGFQNLEHFDQNGCISKRDVLLLMREAYLVALDHSIEAIKS